MQYIDYEKDTWKVLFKKYLILFKENVGKSKKSLTLGLLLYIISSSLSLYIPFISKTLIDDVIIKADLELLKTIILLLCGLFVLLAVNDFLYNYIFLKLGEKVNASLKFSLYKRILNQNYSFFHDRKTGELTYRIFDDTKTIFNSLVSVPTTFLVNLLILIAGGVLLMMLQWELTLLISILFIFQLFVARKFFTPIKEKAHKAKMAGEKLKGEGVEHLNNIYLIKTNAAVHIFKYEFFKKLSNLLRRNIDFGIIMKISQIVSSAFANLVMFLILAYGSYEIIKGRLTIGGMVAFMGLIKVVYNPAATLVKIILNIPEIGVCIRRYFEIYSLPEEDRRDKGSNNLRLKNLSGKIEFKNVKFGYNSQKLILDDFSFTIHPGTKLGVIGRSGIGKSTLINLIVGLYTSNSGDLYIDNTNITDLDLSYLRANIGIVAQNNFVYDGAIIDNINFRKKNLKYKDIVNAAEKAHIKEYIDSLKDGFYTKLGENGLKLSGGEAQRIAIARVFLQNPNIILWDEPTSFLDEETEKKIVDSFERLTNNKTAIVVTHKKEILSKVDVIIDLEKMTATDVNSKCTRCI